MKKIWIVSLITAVALLAGCGEKAESANSAESGSDLSINYEDMVNGSSSTSSEETRPGAGTYSYTETEETNDSTADSGETTVIEEVATEETDTAEAEEIEEKYEPVKAEYIPDYDVTPSEGTSSYNPKKALAYAEKNWDSGKGLCAEFGSNCLKAGGITDCWSTSSTMLYNSLIKSGEGFAVKVAINEDGTINLPEYAFPGDMIFYYCEKENCMVHTLIYSGDNRKGKIKALAHNPANGGKKSFKYRPTCTDGCTAELKDVVLFCFYRNPKIMKAPNNLPDVTVEKKDDGYLFSWEPEFLYKSSTLILLNKNGEEIYRREMATDTDQKLEITNTSALSACVEYTICDGVTVRSTPIMITFGEENVTDSSGSSEVIEEDPPHSGNPDNSETPAPPEAEDKPTEPAPPEAGDKPTEQE